MYITTATATVLPQTPATTTTSADTGITIASFTSSLGHNHKKHQQSTTIYPASVISPCLDYCMQSQVDI